VRSADRHGDPVTRARSTKRRSVLPGVAQFRGYQRGWLRGDLLAGITVAAYLVPQVMAYAEVAGLPPVTGLWAILGPLAVYALLGSSRQLSVGPESTTALMTAVVLLPLAAGDPVRYATLAAALAVMVGLICVVGGLARLGFLADLLSKPVLVGYMAGVAVIMIVSQLGKISGVPVEGDGFLPEVGSWLSNLGKVHWPTLLLAAGLLTLLFLLQWLLPLAPGPLIVVVLGAVVVAVVLLAGPGRCGGGRGPRGFAGSPAARCLRGRRRRSAVPGVGRGDRRLHRQRAHRAGVLRPARSAS
jgi:SulP family sulfate permease